MEPASVSLTFDDGLRCQFKHAVPVLDHYEFPATFFLIANQELAHEGWLSRPGRLSPPKIQWNTEDVAILKQLVAEGHEIGSHGLTHHPDIMKTQPDKEAIESKQLIEGWMGTNVSSFCYPYYTSHAYLADAVTKAGYAQARAGSQASFYESNARLDRFNVDCRQILPNETVSDWIQPGCWHVLTFHAIGGREDGYAPISVEEFERQMGELAKLRDSGFVDVLNFAEGARRRSMEL